MINDPAKKLLLQVELAITVDVGETFVKATLLRRRWASCVYML